jgi:glycosyltransferase involved in cell wall biosynthesis
VTYGLVAIVKDEAERIDRFVESVRPLISAWTIVDTGSTDGSPELIRNGLAGIQGRLLEAPFVDFGTTRSIAFAAARGTADWLLALDADMTVEIDAEFEPDPDVAAYLIRMGDEAFEYRLPLVLRGDLPWISRGAVHEYTCLEDGSLGRREPTDAIRIRNSGADRSSPAKTRWQAELLEAELVREPDNPRTTFYVAQTLREIGDARSLERAAVLYRRRAEMGGWIEESWYARFRAALLEVDWPARLAALLAAWDARPARLEPLYHVLRELNARDQHATAYALARSVDPSSRPADILFVEPWIWTYGIAFERSVAAWWLGRRDEFARLTAELLELPLTPAIRAAVEANAAA